MNQEAYMSCHAEISWGKKYDKVFPFHAPRRRRILIASLHGTKRWKCSNFTSPKEKLPSASGGSKGKSICTCGIVPTTQYNRFLTKKVSNFSSSKSENILRIDFFTFLVRDFVKRHERDDLYRFVRRFFQAFFEHSRNMHSCHGIIAFFERTLWQHRFFGCKAFQKTIYTDYEIEGTRRF